MTNETNQKISRKAILARTAKKIGIDAIILGSLGVYLGSMPLVGQLPEVLKLKCYREKDSSLAIDTQDSTHAAIGTNVLGGIATRAYLGYNIEGENNVRFSIFAGMMGGLVGLVSNFPYMIAKANEQKNGLKRYPGSIHGYILSIPVWTGYGLYKAAQVTGEYLGNRYREAKSELESQLEKEVQER